MKALLIDLDSKIPNLALMKISAYHKAQGDEVGFNVADPDRIYVSCVFDWNKHKVASYAPMYGVPVIAGGSGLGDWTKVLSPEIERIKPDYDLYPNMEWSMGFTTRGCMRRCHFCIVPAKEGRLVRWQHPSEFCDDRFKTVYLLDNNWLADRPWFMETSKWFIDQGIKIKEGGMDIRLVDEEIAGRLADMKWDRDMKFAFDDMATRPAIERGINCLKTLGLTPGKMSYLTFICTTTLGMTMRWNGCVY